MKNKLLRRVASLALALVMVLVATLIVPTAEARAAGIDSAELKKVNEKINDSVYAENANYYKFMTETDGYIVVSAAITSPSCLFQVIIYDDSLSEVYRSDLYATNIETRRLMFGKNKAFYVKVSQTYGNYTTPTTYVFEAKEKKEEGWESEPNDTVEDANIIYAGKPIIGTAWHSNDKDYYKYTVGTPSTQTITLQNIDMSGNYFSISIYDSEFKLIESESYIGSWTSDELHYSKGDVLYIVVNLSWLDFGLDSRYRLTVTEENGTQEMFRLFNSTSGEHFYTGNAKERDYLVSVGWKYEGVGWTAPLSSNTPVYRLCNTITGDHHYTTSASEKDYLSKTVWTYEGICWYSDDNKSVPLYRAFNPNLLTGSHNYTSDSKEQSYLTSHGWNDEGIGWYGVNK